MSQFTATDHTPYTDNHSYTDGHSHTDDAGPAGPRPDEESAHDETAVGKVVTEPAGAREDTAADEHAAPVAALQPTGTARPAETGGFESDEYASPPPTSPPPMTDPAMVTQAGPVPAGPAAAVTSTEAGRAHLLDGADLEQRWQLVQSSFVDEPRQAVEDADALVAVAVRTLSDALEGKRSGLKNAWNGSGGSGGSDTEQLRVALRSYRDLFRQLLTV